MHEKILNMINNEGNIPQNRNEVSTSHLLEWLSSKRQETRFGEDEEKIIKMNFLDWDTHHHLANRLTQCRL